MPERGDDSKIKSSGSGEGRPPVLAGVTKILAATGREAVFVRQLAIVASLLLGGCAAPGASGMSSFMSTMHPTQEFCASRGMTLDSATKQCATAPPAAAPQQTQPSSEIVTGSLPQAASAQSHAPSPPSTLTSQAASSSAQSPAPATAPTQPPPPLLERKQSAQFAPVEPNAVVYAGTDENVDLSELAHFVRASGYRCDSISALQRLQSSHGYRLVCNDFSFKYAIEDKDDKTTVALE
jgi:hypothetical protein